MCKTRTSIRASQSLCNSLTVSTSIISLVKQKNASEGYFRAFQRHSLKYFEKIHPAFPLDIIEIYDIYYT